MSRECWGCMVKPSERAKCEERSRTGFKEWQRHHVLPQQVLKREFPHGVYVSPTGGAVPIKAGAVLEVEQTRPGMEFSELAAEVDARTRTLEQLRGDERNLIWMREYHHLALEARHLTIYFEDVPAEACEFAAELGMSHHLERLYPPAASADWRAAAESIEAEDELEMFRSSEPSGLQEIAQANVTAPGMSIEDLTEEGWRNAFKALSRAAVTPAPKYPVPRAELERGGYDARSMMAGAAVLVGCWPDEGEGEQSEFRDGWMAAARHLRAVADACAPVSDVEDLEAPRDERWEP